MAKKQKFTIENGYKHKDTLKDMSFKFDKKSTEWHTSNERDYLIALIKTNRSEHPETTNGEFVVRYSDPAEMRVVERQGLCRWDTDLRLSVAPTHEQAQAARAAADKVDLWKMQREAQHELDAAGIGYGDKTHPRGFGTVKGFIVSDR